MYIYIYLYTYTHISMYIHIYLHMRVFVFMYICKVATLSWAARREMDDLDVLYEELVRQTMSDIADEDFARTSSKESIGKVSCGQSPGLVHSLFVCVYINTCIYVYICLCIYMLV